MNVNWQWPHLPPRNVNASVLELLGRHAFSALSSVIVKRTQHKCTRPLSFSFVEYEIIPTVREVPAAHTRALVGKVSAAVESLSVFFPNELPAKYDGLDSYSTSSHERTQEGTVAVDLRHPRNESIAKLDVGICSPPKGSGYL